MNISKTLLFRGKLIRFQLQANVYGTYWQILDEFGTVLQEGQVDFRFVPRLDDPTIPHSILDEQMQRYMQAA